MLTNSHSEVYPANGHASWRIPPRVDKPELLEMGVGSVEDVQTNLNDMWRINRFLGGLRAITGHLYPRLRAAKEVVTLVDLATGSADMPVAIARWAKREPIAIRILAVDLAARHLAIARRQTDSVEKIEFLQVDAVHLPFAPQSVDFMMSSLFLHHLKPEQVVELLRQAFACVRGGLVMSDLVRAWLPLIAFKLGQPFFARSYLTRHDGLLSIRRAYTPSELQMLAHAAGLTNFYVYKHWPWRMTLVADK
jgi:hypothetical protein